MRGFVFIDGSNFYHKLKDLTAGRKQEFPLSSFDFHAFATWLSAPGELVGVRYYIGAVRRDGSEKSQALYTDQQRLIGRLQQQGCRDRARAPDPPPRPQLPREGCGRAPRGRDDPPGARGPLRPGL